LHRFHKKSINLHNHFTKFIKIFYLFIFHIFVFLHGISLFFACITLKLLHAQETHYSSFFFTFHNQHHFHSKFKIKIIIMHIHLIPNVSFFFYYYYYFLTYPKIIKILHSLLNTPPHHMIKEKDLEYS
jgi:hypothetical protein